MTKIFTGSYWRTRSGFFDYSLAKNGFDSPSFDKKRRQKKRISIATPPQNRQMLIKHTINALVDMKLRNISDGNWGTVPRAMRAEIKNAGGIEFWLDVTDQRPAFNNCLRKKEERRERQRRDNAQAAR